MNLEQLSQAIEEERKVCLEEIKEVDNIDKLNLFKGKHIGKKSLLTELFASMRNVDANDKKEYGKMLTSFREEVNSLFVNKEKELADKKLLEKINNEKVDITLPPYSLPLGSYHPLTLITEEMVSFFKGLGFEVASGPEVETERNNFELVNIPSDHPSRDMQDSFVVDKGIVLRSHTSAVQSRVMQSANGRSPIKIICPGKVYRRDSDATHSHQFEQMEGLVISSDATFANLLELLTKVLRHLFGEKREVRFRPSYFPFTEPSIEADISCFECNGKGCSLCKHTGWIEILGAGMVHPNVLRLNGYDDNKVQGFAFGIGIDRVAMLKYGIDDIKRFYLDDVRFLRQFKKE